MSTEPSTEREEWDDLLRAPAWARLFAWAKGQYFGAAFRDQVKRAESIEEVRAINRVADEMTVLFAFPQTRIDQLDKAKQAPEQTPSRRGSL